MREEPKSQEAYHCTSRWNREHSSVLVVCCSDGRFISAVEEFLHHKLAIPYADRYVVPGGPACLTIAPYTLHDYDLARKRIHFLVESHHTTRSVLIAHQDCGFYHAGLPDLDVTARQATQHQHLYDGARTLQAWFPTMKVERYYATVRQGRVVFMEV